jgi:hypothetical protein
MDNELWGVGRTFVLVCLALVLTFLGCYLMMWPPDIFVNVLTVALPAYAGKTVGGAFAGAMKKKYDSGVIKDVPVETKP